MNITVVMDSFKGSLTSMEAGKSIKKGILRVYPEAVVNVRPLGDGGEGTSYALTMGMAGEWVQIIMGKAPVGVAKIAKEYRKPVIAFAGCVTKGAVECHREGIDAYFPILQEVVTLEDAMRRENAAENMANTAEQVFRLIRVLGC